MTEKPKPKTFNELAAQRGDATADAEEHKPTLTIAGQGLQGTGKTLFGLNTMPLPMLHLNLDRTANGLFYMKDGGVAKERQQDIVSIQFGPENHGSANWTESTAAKAREELEAAIQQYVPLMQGGTVFIDGGTNLANLVTSIELAKVEKALAAKAASKGKEARGLLPFDYANINTWWAGLLGALNRANVHFYITNHLTEEWGADGPIPGRFYAQQNKLNKKMEGMTLDSLDFPTLYKMTYGTDYAVS